MDRKRHNEISHWEEGGIAVTKMTHFNEEGRAKMVEVGHKLNTQREAICHGSVRMKPETIEQILTQNIHKGDVLAVAQVAGLMSAKKTSDLIPMCHNVSLTGADIQFSVDRENNCIDIVGTIRTTGKTGVEMEAMTAVSVAALTIYDMCKSIDREITISEIYLVKKAGGKSGDYVRDGWEEHE